MITPDCFEPLDEEEQKAVRMKLKRLGAETGCVLPLTRVYLHQDNFTTCILQGRFGDRWAIGVTKRMPTDDPDPSIGQRMALNRAMEHLWYGDEWVEE